MKISREELYKLIWAEPMISVCKKYGLSDNGLRKQCNLMDIPTPPVGYWSKLKHGKKTEIIPLPKKPESNKQSTDLTEIEITLLPPMSRNAIRESEIRSGDTSIFAVPEVLYAKDPIIIDTKEKFRHESDNDYLKKNPFKVKTGPTLNISVSDKSMDRALSIFETIIKALQFRGWTIKVKDNLTYVVINSEEIHVDLTERLKQVPNTEDTYSKYMKVFSGDLHFNIYYGYRDKDTFKDTSQTRMEDKIIPIIANLEIRAEKIKEERIEDERRRLIRETEERLRREFKEKKEAEKKEFKSLFLMAERLHKTHILRQYISTFEEFVSRNGDANEEIGIKIEWAKSKADWLDPFISKEDQYLDSSDKDEITKTECPRKNTWEYPSYTSTPMPSFWSSPYRKWRQ